MKKFVSLFLCLAMLFSMLVTTTMAAGGSSNVIVETDPDTVEAGGTFTVTIENTDMTVASIACGIFFDTKKVKCVSIVGSDPDDPNWFAIYKSGGKKYSEASAKPSVDGSNTTGTVGFTWIGTEETAYIAGTIATVTFEVDEAATGSVDILVYETSDGTDGINLGNKYNTYEEAKNDATLGKRTVTITKPDVKVTGVELSSNTLSLDIGGTATLVATVQPNGASNKAVTFVSSAPDVVQVVNAATGEIKGLKEGSATITVTTTDGGFTATCVVTVACKHTNKTPVEEKASDCKDQGWDAYVKCDDCGQLFAEDGTTEIAEIPFRPLSQQHTGGTATCTAQAVCTVCGASYGPLADHSFTAAVEKAEALKTEANCRDKAVYYYSCSVCGEVEKNNENHTFEAGVPNPNNHVGPTKLVGAKPADHKNQIDGYTGDTVCDECGEVVAGGKGSVIPAGAHEPSDNWSSDGVNHWKTCTVTGCGVEIENTKAPHSQAGDWKSDADKHWKECGVCGNTVITSTQGAHVYDQEVATEAYKASGATCTAQAVYWKSCVCGKASTTETFASGNTAPHTPSTEWSSDGTHHWKTCTVDGCGAVIENTKTTHTESSAWSSDGTHHWKTCTVCGVKIPATEAVHAYNTAWDSNTTQHWHSCVCGDKTDVGNHVDADKNNKCDTCERNMYTGGAGGNVHNCYDFNSDGKCDTCGDKINCKHPDVNKDGYCDKCCAAIKTVESVQTFDAGIVMYAGMAVLAATGSAVVIGKKRKEQ